MYREFINDNQEFFSECLVKRHQKNKLKQKEKQEELKAAKEKLETIKQNLQAKIENNK
jgi:uncharacterized membrane-anchored protein YhcB (DUF1043 family)